ncbi:hypothetical protein D4764_11G0003320 [Takifugu flavidus]|uniref:Uncharacterized protein n=1 Tax=Takifugu flavidus TaxID=433684 RepID=A0A5C6PH74_9TELE|nr:hypothetical protein D4764_11G0003320 [Takifugu flavidus]
MRTITGFQKKGIRSADGEERAGEAQPEKGCRTGRHQPMSAEELLQAAVWNTAAPVRPEPSSSEDPSALNDILPGPGAEEDPSCGIE